MPTLWDKDGKVTKGYQKATPRVLFTHIHYHPLANIKWFLHFDRDILSCFGWNFGPHGPHLRLKLPASLHQKTPPRAQQEFSTGQRWHPRWVLRRIMSYLGGSGAASKISFGNLISALFYHSFDGANAKSSCSKNGRFVKIQTAHPSANCKIDVSGMSKCWPARAGDQSQRQVEKALKKKNASGSWFAQEIEMVEFNDTRHCTCRWTRPSQFTAPDILPGDKTTLVDMVKTCEKHSLKNLENVSVRSRLTSCEEPDLIRLPMFWWSSETSWSPMAHALHAIGEKGQKCSSTL